MLSKRDSVIGIFAGLVTAAGWGTIGLWIKYLPIDSLLLVAIRLVFAGLLFSFAILRKKTKMTLRMALASFVCGAVLYSQFLVTIEAFQLLTVSQASLLTNLQIVFLVIFSQRRFLHILPLCILLVGLLFFFSPSINLNIFSIFLGLLSSCLFAVYTICLDKLFEKNSFDYLPIIFLTAFIISLITLLIFDTDMTLDFTSVAWGPLLGLLLFSTACAHFAFSVAVSTIGNFKATVISYFAIVVGFVVDIFYGHEITITSVLGLILCMYALNRMLRIETFYNNKIPTNKLRST